MIEHEEPEMNSEVIRNVVKNSNGRMIGDGLRAADKDEILT
ncbi:MAG: hypothetical protein O7G83_10965 [Proteobacteria bacterium]|nr:hypothetical protein [Pseudomonadota bacterium]